MVPPSFVPLSRNSARWLSGIGALNDPCKWTVNIAEPPEGATSGAVSAKILLTTGWPAAGKK